MAPPVVVAALLIFALSRWFQIGAGFLSPIQHAVYRMTNGSWLRAPELPGDPDRVLVSSNATVWALLWHHSHGSELARLDGVRWHIYKPADFGTEDVIDDVALDGEHLWAAAGMGVVNWDGSRWKYYHLTAGKNGLTSIVAAGGRVWAIDGQGSLSHFDGAVWQTAPVVLPGIKWDPDEDEPQLARTNDGSLWILRGGLWKQEGSAWVAVKPGGEDARDAWLVGSTSEGIWLWDDRHLGLVRPDQTTAKFDRAELGLETGEGVNALTGTGGRAYLATTVGVLELNGAGWRRMARLPAGVAGVTAIAAGADGAVAAIGYTPNPWARYSRFLFMAVPLALSLGLLAIPVWMVRRHNQYRLREHRQLQRALEYATGAVPEELARDQRQLARQTSWASAILTGGVILAAMVGYSIARLYWPATPRWMFLVIALGLHLAVTLAQSLVRRVPKPWDPIEPGGPGFDWGPTLRAVPASLAVFALMNVGAFPKWMGDPVVWLLYAFLAVMWYRMFAVKFQIRAARRGDYEGALRVARRFHFYNPDGGSVLMQKGNILLLAGRLREAEDAERRALAALRSRGEQARALEALGSVLLAQDRFDEAMRSYEASLNAAPGYLRPYRGMAEVMLRRDHDGARALEYVEKFGKPQWSARSRFLINGKLSDDYWSLKAWSLAESGRGSEVMPAVAEAIRNTNSKSRPDLSTTYCRLGFAMQAIGRQTEAEEYWKKARDVDPGGRWSALVKRALGETNVWRT